MLTASSREPRQEAGRRPVPAVLPRSGVRLPGHHVWQHDRGQHNHAGGQTRLALTRTSSVIRTLTRLPPVSVVPSWCPSRSSLTWWWCPTCTATWWATCVRAWWEGPASFPVPITAMCTPSLKLWVVNRQRKTWAVHACVWTHHHPWFLTGIFQATRNTGKSIADKNIANPTAMLLASCLMLDHLK